MVRFVVVACLTVQLALFSGYGERKCAQPVFFSLLFPQLMPWQEEPESWPFGLFEGAGEAMLL